MNRMYKREDVVNVYRTQRDKDTGNVYKTIKRVPYSKHGFDYYSFDSHVFNGYVDMLHDVDACIILSEAE